MIREGILTAKVKLCQNLLDPTRVGLEMCANRCTIKIKHVVAFKPFI